MARFFFRLLVSILALGLALPLVFAGALFGGGESPGAFVALWFLAVIGALVWCVRAFFGPDHSKSGAWEGEYDSRRDGGTW